VFGGRGTIDRVGGRAVVREGSKVVNWGCRVSVSVDDLGMGGGCVGSVVNEETVMGRGDG
jgi:hypothetical protein